MTVGSQVKQCHYSLRSAKENLQSLSIRAGDDQAKEDLHQASVILQEVITELNERISFLESEEPQYKGF